MLGRCGFQPLTWAKARWGQAVGVGRDTRHGMGRTLGTVVAPMQVTRIMWRIESHQLPASSSWLPSPSQRLSPTKIVLASSWALARAATQPQPVQVPSLCRWAVLPHTKVTLQGSSRSSTMHGKLQYAGVYTKISTILLCERRVRVFNSDIVKVLTGGLMLREGVPERRFWTVSFCHWSTT